MSAAPRDGTNVLLWIPYSWGGGYVEVGSFRVDTFEEDGGAANWYANDHDDFSLGTASTPLNDATYWMPLPTPPAETE